jgi:hypothetical protein
MKFDESSILVLDEHVQTDEDAVLVCLPLASDGDGTGPAPTDDDEDLTGDDDADGGTNDGETDPPTK